MVNKKIYLAGAMSNYAKKGKLWRNKLKDIVLNNNLNIILIDPFNEEYKTTGMCFEDSYKYVYNLIKDNNIKKLKQYMNRIHMNNFSSIRTSDYCFVMIDDGFTKSIGTHIEIEQAYNSGIPIIFILNELKILEKTSVWVYFYQSKIIIMDNITEELTRINKE